MSTAASGLLRALVERAGVSRDRILLRDWRSIDWRSLTFEGERHHLRLRILGPNSADALGQLTLGLEEAEFSIPGQIVADIAMVGEPDHEDDGSATLTIEALTISE